jgi:hypothetical protein
LVIAGLNPAATDYVTTRLMGLDWRKLPMIRESFGIFGCTPEQIEVVPDWGEIFHFRPHFGWTGHIETAQSPATPSPL